MEKAKRARKAETPKQPSLSLRLRATYFYPDHNIRDQAQTFDMPRKAGYVAAHFAVAVVGAPSFPLLSRFRQPAGQGFENLLALSATSAARVAIDAARGDLFERVEAGGHRAPFATGIEPTECRLPPNAM
jgi:hypothetical protein